MTTTKTKTPKTRVEKRTVRHDFGHSITHEARVGGYGVYISERFYTDTDGTDLPGYETTLAVHLRGDVAIEVEDGCIGYIDFGPDFTLFLTAEIRAALKAAL